jgi:hypothetical protein
MTNKCTICGKPSIPGLRPGNGKCQYHWNEGCFGKPWADKIEEEHNNNKQKESA